MSRQPEDVADRPQTKRKWQLLGRYLDAWLAIVSNSFHTAYYVDGYGGWGAYPDSREQKDYDGSPLIAAKLGDKWRDTRARLGGRFRLQLHVSERAAAEHEHLSQVLSQFDVKPVMTDFWELCPELVRDISDTGVPSFWFIDPRGVDIEMAKMMPILDLPRAEVLFHYSQMGVQRTVGAAANIAAEKERLREHAQQCGSRVARMFGLSDFSELPTDNWRDALDLFLSRYQEHMDYVRAFPVKYPQAGREGVLYYLVFATSNNVGLSIMKQVMERLRTEGSLFEAPGSLLPSVDVPCYLEERYGGQEVSWRRVHQETDYHHRELYDALQTLMDKGQVIAHPLPPDKNHIGSSHTFSFKPARQTSLFSEGEEL